MANHRFLTTSSSSRTFWVGVDVGGTKVAATVADQHLKAVGQAIIPTDLTSPAHTVQSITAAVHQALQTAEIPLSCVTAIGVGVPGKVYVESGGVESAVNLKWQKLPLGELLSAQLGVPCFIENDTRLAALGSYQLLHETAVQNLAYVTIGTGIAAGLVLQGKLYRGTHNMAGEIGHMVIEPQGPRCLCGNLGCLESLAAGPAIAKAAQQAVAASQKTILSSVHPLTAQTVFQAAQTGDKVSTQIIEQTGQYLGRAFQMLVMAYDVDRIILGGGVSQAGEALLQPILQEWQRQCRESALAAQLLKPDLLHLLPPNFNAGVWGGIVLAAQQKEVPIETHTPIVN